MRATHFTRVALAAALCTSAACASGGGRSGNDVTALVRVANDAAPSAPLTVWAVPSGGDRRMLGVVQPETTALLRVDRLGATTEYRLTAERANGASVSSRPFRPGGADLIDWTVSTNSLQLLRATRP